VPGLGTTGGGKLQISVGWRHLKATKSYFDSRQNHNFNRSWQPRERLSVLDVTGRYRLTSRLSVIASLPIVMNKFSMLVPPLGPLQSRRDSWGAGGIGDLSVYGQYWLLNPKNHPFGNVNIGLGVKIPTGSWRTRANMPDETGANNIGRYVYPVAMMPGDGGTGIIAGFEAFKTLRTPNLLRGNTLFVSGSYLCNPRDTNGTPSIIQELGVPLAPYFASQLTNSVPDTYSLQWGLTTKVPGTWDKPLLRGSRLRFMWRLEGLTTRDLIGGSHGYRQPGYALSIGPGFSYQFGKNLLMVDVPIVFNRHINPGKTQVPGLPVRTPTGVAPAPFNAFRNLGLIAPLSVSVRYVRTL
jgi:hypothetical protein